MARRSGTTGLTYDDLVRMYPDEDLVRRELIDGELFVTPSPVWAHQRAVSKLDRRLGAYVEEHGGEVAPGPMDTMIETDTVLQPDVLLYVAERVGIIGERPLQEPPDLVVEVSSPSTRRRDLLQKKAKYALFGVREYWFVDLEHQRVELYRLEDDQYGAPRLIDRDGSIESPLLPGLSLPVDDILGSRDG